MVITELMKLRTRVDTKANENIAIDKLRELSGISQNVEFGIDNRT
jgi:hypothetical protein